MAHGVAIPARISPDYRGLLFWMNRTLEELQTFRSDPNTDVVHDLRVALRHSRSIADAMKEVDPHPDWNEMRQAARKMFRSIGELRDVQVMADWLNILCPEDDALKNRLLETLAHAERLTNLKAQRRAERFDDKRWKKLMRSLAARMRRVPPDGDAAHCLALERFEEAKELHRRAMRTDNEKPWHALRVGIKHFRYTTESLLPTAHAEWAESLKRVQEVLGIIHDLDVFALRLRRAIAQHVDETNVDWDGRIAAERGKNIETYRQLALGTACIWSEWFTGFPRDSWERYAKARIRATRNAMDPKPGRSALLSRFALRIWSQLRIQKVATVFSDKTGRRILETAARLGGVREPNAKPNGKPSGKKAREKFARTFLLRTPVPPRWTFAEWERAAWAIRFQRGPEPGPRNKRYSKLSEEQQAQICLLAGILRLAIAAQKAGVTRSSSLRIETLPQVLLLHIAAVEDSPKNAARFTAAKRLLERSLGKAILILAESEISATPSTQTDSAPPFPISIVR
jgi:CHAD domain-containing protein